MNKRALLTLVTLVLLAAGLGLQAEVTRMSSPGVAVGPTANCANTVDGQGGPTDAIAFTEVSASISDVNVQVAVDHTWRGDLQFSVTYSGGGGRVTLALDDDGSADNYYATFDDEAASSCGAVCAVATACTAAPGPTCSPDQALSAFDGLASPGTWTLEMCDDAGGDGGTWVSWSVTANGQPGDGLPIELVEFEVETR